MMKRMSLFNVANSPSFSELHQEGQTDIFPGAERGGWDESIPLGPCSFLINSGRCSTPRLLCIRCIPGSPYEVHLPHTHARIQPQQGTRGYHWSPRGHGRCSDTPWREPGVDNSLSLFTQANIYKKLLNSSR